MANKKCDYIIGDASGIGLAQALAREVSGTGVSVHLICPPEVYTPMIMQETATVMPETRFLKDLGGSLQPEVAAAEIARGLQRGCPVICPGFRARLFAWIAQHFPGLFGNSSDLLLRLKFGR